MKKFAVSILAVLASISIAQAETVRTESIPYNNGTILVCAYDIDEIGTAWDDSAWFLRSGEERIWVSPNDHAIRQQVGELSVIWKQRDVILSGDLNVVIGFTNLADAKVNFSGQEQTICDSLFNDMSASMLKEWYPAYIGFSND